MPVGLRLRALDAFATASFRLTAAERATVRAIADTVMPGAQVQTRLGLKTIPPAGETGVDDYIDNLISGSFLYAAGVRRPPYVQPAAPVFPAAGAMTDLWLVKRMGWFGDPRKRPTRPRPWPSELQRLQGLYREGLVALDAGAGGSFAGLPAAAREVELRRLQAQETVAFNGGGEGGQPFFLTFLDHLSEACFGDPVYGGNRGWVYWDMINFSGPSFVDGGGPHAGQGWTAEQMTGPFRRP